MQETIVIKSDESIILTMPVMIPGAKDCDYLRGEIPLTVEQVKAFKEAYDDYGFIDKHHSIRGESSASKDKLVAKALKSFLLSEETEYKWFNGTTHTYPAGTWMLTSEVTDPIAIKQAKEGLITGASPSVFPRHQAEKIRAALKASQGGLIKDITDPVPALVSLVYKPCQSGNKFCDIGENMSEERKAQSKIKQITNILGGKDPEYAMKEDLDDFKEEIMESFKSDDFKSFITNAVNVSVSEALKGVSLKGDDIEGDDETTHNKEGDDPEGKSNPEDNSGNEDNENDETPATKSDQTGDSKKLPQHNGEQQVALKSDRSIVFEIMGRSSNGRPKKQ